MTAAQESEDGGGWGGWRTLKPPNGIDPRGDPREGHSTARRDSGFYGAVPSLFKCGGEVY